MKEASVKIVADDCDYEIGRLAPWKDDPQTFDGWLEETPGGAVDELVVNGAPEWWARYRVLARYMETLLAEINSTEGKGRPLDVLTVAHASARLSGTAEEMDVALAAHLAAGN